MNGRWFAVSRMGKVVSTVDARTRQAAEEHFARTLPQASYRAVTDFHSSDPACAEHTRNLLAGMGRVAKRATERRVAKRT